MKRKISDLLASQLGMLTDAERRLRLIALELCVPKPCPHCEKRQSYFAACSMISMDDYDFDVGEQPNFSCIKCHRALGVIRPLVGPDWRFTPMITLEELRNLRLAAEKSLAWFRRVDNDLHMTGGALETMMALEAALKSCTENAGGVVPSSVA